jgi:XTP/dITP diphosphohydrolase
MKLIFATGNKGKLKEVKKIFSNTKYEIISLDDLGFTGEIEETGKTFEENAFIKAETIFNKFKIPVIADDSGLMVKQLDWRPGVYSARYAGENATYDDNNKKLLEELKPFPQPHLAKFVCCAVYVDEKEKISVTGELEGEIIKEYKGENGFGFDPIFKPFDFSQTLAEMKLNEKNKISHRAKAFEKLKEKIT